MTTSDATDRVAFVALGVIVFHVGLLGAFAAALVALAEDPAWWSAAAAAAFLSAGGYTLAWKNTTV